MHAPNDEITFAFDFVDPGSYLVAELLHRWLPGGLAEGVPPVHLLPLELNTPPDPLISPSEEGWRAMHEALAEEARLFEIPFSPPAFVPWTRKAHELAMHAEEGETREGDHPDGDTARPIPMHLRLFRARFVEGRDLGRVDVLVEVADEAGLDPAEVRTVLGVDRFEPAVREARSEAMEMEIRGVPTLLHGSRRMEGFRTAEEMKTFLREGGVRTTDVTQRSE